MPQSDVSRRLEAERGAALDEDRRPREQTGGPGVVVGVETRAPGTDDPLRRRRIGVRRADEGHGYQGRNACDDCTPHVPHDTRTY